jgi:GT2 family glycosyltransferase
MPRLKKLIYIIIINYNTVPFIANCLDSLKKADFKKYKVRVIIFDNNSTDNSFNLIKEKYPFFKALQNKKNLGFAKAANKGIKTALKRNADFVFLLNPDTIVSKDFLPPLIKLMQKDSSVGIASPLLKEFKGSKIYYTLGAGFNPFLGRVKHKKQEFRPLKPVKEEMVSGCAMLIRKKVFEKIGFFDEQFYLFYEDSDFCKRAGEAHFKIYIHPKSVVFHKVSASFKGFSWKKIYFVLKSNIIFTKKHVKTIFKPLAFLYLMILGTKMITSKLFSLNAKKEEY